MRIFATKGKLNRLEEMISGVKVGMLKTVKQWAQVRGFIVSLVPALGKRLLLCSRALANDVAAHEN